MGLVVAEIICLIKIRTYGKQTDRQTDTGVIKPRENIKVVSFPIDSTTVLP